MKNFLRYIIDDIDEPIPVLYGPPPVSVVEEKYVVDKKNRLMSGRTISIQRISNAKGCSPKALALRLMTTSCTNSLSTNATNAIAVTTAEPNTKARISVR